MYITAKLIVTDINTHKVTNLKYVDYVRDRKYVSMLTACMEGLLFLFLLNYF